MIPLTEVFLWMSRGVCMCVCVCGVGGFNKAECISLGMKLQRLEGAEERGKAAEVLQISVCE